MSKPLKNNIPTKKKIFTMDTSKKTQEIDKLLKAELPKKMRESLEKRKDILLNNKTVKK